MEPHREKMKKPTKLLLLCFSGKRRAGKDASAILIKDQFHDHPNVQVTNNSIGYLPKQQYAEEKGVDLHKILNDVKFKEIHRQGIIDISLQKRKENSWYWVTKCFNSMIQQLKSSNEELLNVVCIPDIRFCSELEYLTSQKVENFDINVRKIRIEASDQIRKQRGWVFNEEIDKGSSETELDGYLDWDFVVENNTNSFDNLQSQLQPIIECISKSK